MGLTRLRYRARCTAVALAATVGILSPAAASAVWAHSPPRGDVAGVVARAMPAVVSITTRRIERDQFGQSVPSRDLGSGVIVDRRGYIVTNNHVVEDAEQIKVALPDERVFPARLVGADRFTDLAVLKIDGAKLPVAALGDSAQLRVGETVMAIGNPLWIEGGPSVTVGVVSGLKRSMEQEGLPMLHHLIQTDAAINPGNSGGPLIDGRGRVVGINTALIPSAHGIGFAMSIDAVKPVLAALIARGRVTRPTLGLTAVSVTPQVAYVNELTVGRGALVVNVEPNGPGEAAGFRPDDVIIGVEGRPVRNLHELHDVLMRGGVGQRVEIIVRRGQESLVLRPVLEEY